MVSLRTFSLLFFFLVLFLREYGQVENRPDWEQASGGKREEDIAINVVVNLKMIKWWYGQPVAKMIKWYLKW